MVIIKSDVDMLLSGILHDQMVIQLWWNSPNTDEVFGGKTPLYVYQNVDNGNKIVYDYVLKHYNGDYS